jgi:GTPase SAR1 family protein
MIMHADQASHILLVQSIESIDEEGEILPFHLRQQANDILEGDDAGSPQHAYARRADKILTQITHRHSIVIQASLDMIRLPKWCSWLLYLCAILLGSSMHVWEGSRSFHILSTTLIICTLWNLASIIFLVLFPILKSKKSSVSVSSINQSTLQTHHRYTSRLSRSLLSIFLFFYQKRSLKYLIRGDSKKDQLYIQIIQKFWQQWFTHAGHFIQSRWAYHLHIAAICVVVSALSSAYISGLTTAYQASVASTFFETEQVLRYAHLFLWPATIVWGKLQVVQTNNALIGPAAPWVHYYTLSLAIYIVLPRLLATAYTAYISWRSMNNFYLPLQSLSDIPTLNIALSSHTNVGKTSLARTLLRRDVGEVRDAEHVTKTRAGYFLIYTDKARLRLWDTPGFADAKVLTKHLKQKKGWIWLKDLQNKSLQFDKEAALSLKEEADLILYVVPSNLDQHTKTQVLEEWELLTLLNRPIIVILNRISTHQAHEVKTILEQWEAYLSSFSSFAEILTLDAFCRTWHDEEYLFNAIVKHVDHTLKNTAQHCRDQWHKQHKQQTLDIVTCFTEILLFLVNDRAQDKVQHAELQLQQRAQDAIQDSQQHILDYLGLAHDVQEQMISHSESLLQSVIPRKGERTWGAVIGGAVSGLLSGIMTDVLAGGFTFFGGAAVGLLLGAVGGASIAEGYSKIKGKEGKILVWNEDFIKGVMLKLVFIYITAATFGRARGVFNDESLGSLNTAFLQDKLKEHPSHTTEEHQHTLKETRQAMQLYALKSAQESVDMHWSKIWDIANHTRQQIHDDSIWFWSSKAPKLELPSDQITADNSDQIRGLFDEVLQTSMQQWLYHYKNNGQ